jgi:hypothetical protein
MPDDKTFRPRKVNPNEQDANMSAENSPFAGVDAMRAAAAADDKESTPPGPLSANPGIQISGKVPPEFLKAINQNRAAAAEERGEGISDLKTGFGKMKTTEQPRKQQFSEGPTQVRPTAGSPELRALIDGLKPKALYEPIKLPSLGRFYDGTNGPTDGVLRVRPMTGEEEQILATPRFVRKGMAINMIFQRCMEEEFRAEDLLTVDRTYLLIWLRGISYSPDYDVEVKCPFTEKKFMTTINLNTLEVEECPDDYGPDLNDVLPSTGYKFNYRLSTGKDEQEIQEYRDRRMKMFGDNASDDTLLHRTAMLLNNVEGVDDKKELMTLIKHLPINDVAFIRNCVNEPPFGVETTVTVVSPYANEEFEIELPLEANFFFPKRRRKEKTEFQ